MFIYAMLMYLGNIKNSFIPLDVSVVLILSYLYTSLSVIAYSATTIYLTLQLPLNRLELAQKSW